MEELPQDQNIFPSELQNNNINNMNYSMFEQINHPGLDIDMGMSNLNQNLLKTKDNTIKQLKRKIQAYEKNTEVQNQKLSDYDHLLVEYNSLNKNYTQLENDLEIIRNENIQLKDIINTKNQTIIDFQGLFEASKSKFDLFNQTNSALKARIEELESKLKMYPNILKNKEDLELHIGNDINDLSAMNIVGYTGCPYDADQKIKEISGWIATRKGGDGVVRELYNEWIKQNDQENMK